MSHSTDPAVVKASGAVLWRGTGAGLEVALVHRPKYDDWSWPKGKLDPGESWPAAAIREVREETGMSVRLGLALPTAHYAVSTPTGIRQKIVRYWAAEASDQVAECVQEVDAVCWLDPEAARRRLDYHRDRAQLAAVLAADRAGELRTWPLVIIRHARAVPRKDWPGTQANPPIPDALRPLLEHGQQRALELIPVLAAYGVARVVSSGSIRCASTVAPYAQVIGRKVLAKTELSEEGFAADPAGVRIVLDAKTRDPKPTAVCTHRPVLPAVLRWLADRCVQPEVAASLRESAGPGLVKGELLVAQLVGSGARARVVSIERQHSH